MQQKEVLRGKFITLSVFIENQEIFQIDNLTFLKEQGKLVRTKFKSSRNEEIVKIRANKQN